MNVKDAVATAKTYVADLFSNEPIQHIGLEEVEFDDRLGVWSITIGFNRSWYASVLGYSAKDRDYKVVRISDSDGKVISIKNRELVG